MESEKSELLGVECYGGMLMPSFIYVTMFYVDVCVCSACMCVVCIRCIRLCVHAIYMCMRMLPGGCVSPAGGLWHTWFDRGLGVAGSVTFKSANKLTSKLVEINSPICYIPNLCIHLQSADERAAFKINKEAHLRPILKYKGDGDAKAAGGNNEKSTEVELPYQFSPSLLSAVASAAGVNVSDIVSWDLCLHDVTPSRLGGINQEYVDAQGLDNKSSVYANFKTLIQVCLHVCECVCMRVRVCACV